MSLESCRYKHTQREKDLLFSIVEPKLNIVESKRNDARSIQRKKTAWEDISNSYNAVPEITRKLSAVQLKKFWQNLKAK